MVIRAAKDVMLTPVQFYLFLYNVLQSFGWSVILWKTLRGLLRNESYQQLYQSCELELQIFQTAAVLEIFHAAACFVRSPVGTTALQLFSRVTLVWLILYKVVSAQVSIGVLFLLMAWSVTEVVRYSYYALALTNAVSNLHTWLRQVLYSFFIALYPLGVSGELLVVLAALPEVSTKKHFTVELPNIFNIGFSFWWYLIAYIILYAPGFPQMYKYMLKQRKKVLSMEVSKKCD
uniref:Very-long-chain (3R)-3-hydroxyacyl-CoA dehydratase n=1 Tax=Onchocerca volvulus TaxID=6282 RepID=A0A8R1TR49_ONCVO